MQILILLSILSTIAVGTVAGVRLLLIARRTRKVPEFAAGVGLLGFAVGESSLTGLRLLSGADESSHVAPLVAVAVASFVTTLLSLSVFVWQTFGPSSNARRGLVAVLWFAALLCGWGTVDSVWAQLSGGPPPPLHWRLGLDGSFLILFCWISIDALAYFGKMRRRMAVGLADPVVTNRFFVWGLGSGLCVLCVVAAAVSYAVTSPTGQEARGAMFGAPVAVAGLTSSITWWLTFFPPASYLGWIRSRARMSSAPA
jgi:hypothetical protein